jgi:hypothetical protein
MNVMPLPSFLAIGSNPTALPERLGADVETGSTESSRAFLPEKFFLFTLLRSRKSEKHHEKIQ